MLNVVVAVVLIFVKMPNKVLLGFYFVEMAK